MLVIEAMDAVIQWHEEGLLPMSACLNDDARCRLVHGDFFAMAASPDIGCDPHSPGRRFDAILLDIDHSPSDVLEPSNAGLYTAEGMSRLREHLRPRGVFAMWSNFREDPGFTHLLEACFGDSRAAPVVLENLIQGNSAHQCVYVARR